MKDSLLLAIFILVFVAIWVFFICMGRKGMDNYDERQEINRSKAHKAAFITVCAWETLYFFTSSIAEISIPVEDSVMTFSGVLIGVCVYALTCIFTDAYFPINQSYKNFSIAMMAAIGIMDIIVSISRIADRSILTDGKLNNTALNLLAGLILLTVSVACLIKKGTDRKHSAEE